MAILLIQRPQIPTFGGTGEGAQGRPDSPIPGAGTGYGRSTGASLSFPQTRAARAPAVAAGGRAGQRGERQ